MYAHDLGSTRYSTLTQINTRNVASLTKAWSYKLSAGGSEATPIVVGGTMYAPSAKNVVALDAATGQEVWSYTLKDGTSGSRGVAYWPGDADNPARIVFTAGTKLVALNAATGKLDPGFGKEGEVEIGVQWTGVPEVYKNLLMLGATLGEVPIGPPGNSRAYDARTGAKLWEFHSVPPPGEVGHETWLDSAETKDGWRGRSGANVWGWYLTVDEARGLVYMPFGSPAANYYGGDRPGSGLFGNSIVAVDAQTGKYKWHFQTVHHDLWDSDLPPAPGLVDITVNGKKVPALAQIGKAAYMYILNRETGEPVFGVEERGVAPGDVPGEWYSPTQPFPSKASAVVAREFEERRSGDPGRHYSGACQGVPGSVG